MLYSKNGSIPYDYTDGTDGWVEIEEPPVVPEGKEVVWWYPPGWVIRDPKPAATDTTDWSWSQSEERWVEYPKPIVENVAVVGENSVNLIDSSTAQATINI